MKIVHQDGCSIENFDVANIRLVDGKWVFYVMWDTNVIQMGRFSEKKEAEKTLHDLVEAYGRDEKVFYIPIDGFTRISVTDNIAQYHGMCQNCVKFRVMCDGQKSQPGFNHFFTCKEYLVNKEEK